MPINREISGNLVTEIKKGIYTGAAHGCNTMNRMVTGIAPELARHWPKLRDADQKAFEKGRAKLGGISGGVVSEATVFKTPTKIFNLYLQDTNHKRNTGGRDVSYDAVVDAFTLLNDQYLEEDMCSIVIPTLGAGLGGGDWRIIRALIDMTTPNLDITVVHYDGSKV